MEPEKKVEKKWLRTCQSCFHKQEDVEPEYGKELPISYTERKCKRCKSIDFDYGSWQDPNETEEDAK